MSKLIKKFTISYRLDKVKKQNLMKNLNTSNKLSSIGNQKSVANDNISEEIIVNLTNLGNQKVKKCRILPRSNCVCSKEV